MQKWEYLFIQNGPVIHMLHGEECVDEDDPNRTYSENGTKSNGNKQELWAVANKKGAEGWEVVSAVQGHHWELVLRRPKPESISN